MRISTDIKFFKRLDGGSYSVEEPEVPSMGQVVDRERVCLGRKGEDGLNRDVHDHHTLGAEVERQDFEGIGNKQPRETNGVEDTKDPDKDNLRNTKAFRLVMAFVFAGHGSPDCERNNHA